MLLAILASLAVSASQNEVGWFPPYKSKAIALDCDRCGSNGTRNSENTAGDQRDAYLYHEEQAGCHEGR